MRILFLNWKDFTHPNAGGAEAFTLAVTKGLVARGHHVTWFGATYPGASVRASIDGINLIRGGSGLSVYNHARRYATSLPVSERPDVIFDEVNTRPFFAGDWGLSGSRVVNLIHQLAREVWFQETPLPLAVVGRYLLEGRWLRRISGFRTITVSKSSRDDLLRLGFVDVRIAYNALPALEPWDIHEKADPPVLLFMGRLSRGKRPDDALKAFRIISRQLSNTRFIVVGDGPLRSKLQRNFPRVKFVGRVNEGEKWRILRTASIILSPGTREGWGRSVMEAQAVGTVPICYDIPGLRDATDFGRTGVLTSSNTPETLAQSATELLRDPSRRSDLADRASIWSRSFRWDDTVSRFEDALD